MTFISGGIRLAAITLSVSALLSGAGSSSASAQAVYWLAPSPGYGYVPPMPIYRPEPRYFPRPDFPEDIYERGPRARPLSPAQVRNMLNERGMRVTGAPTRNGRVFVADVRDRNGIERRVIVDGLHGQVLQSFPASLVRQARPPVGPGQGGQVYAGRPLDPEVDPDYVPQIEPRVIPGIGRNGASEHKPLPGSRISNQKKGKPAKKIAAKPPIGKIAPGVAPLAPALAAPSVPAPAVAAPVTPVAPAPVQAAPEQVPQPVATTPAMPAENNAAPISPATPAASTSPVTGEPEMQPPQPHQAVKAAKEPEPLVDRARRRVRFLKPDAPVVPEGVQQPGVVAAPAPPVDSPRPVAAKPAAPAPAPSVRDEAPVVPVAPLE